MVVQHLLRRLGNQQAVDNARAASTNLARRRVEREAVVIFLERLEERRVRASGPGAAAHPSATAEG